MWCLRHVPYLAVGAFVGLLIAREQSAVSDVLMRTDDLEERSFQVLAHLAIGILVIGAAVVWSLCKKLHHKDEKRQQ